MNDVEITKQIVEITKNVSKIVEKARANSWKGGISLDKVDAFVNKTLTEGLEGIDMTLEDAESILIGLVEDNESLLDDQDFMGALQMIQHYQD